MHRKTNSLLRLTEFRPRQANSSVATVARPESQTFSRTSRKTTDKCGRDGDRKLIRISARCSECRFHIRFRGMLGLPGDFTPPSRFVRAVAFSKTALPVEKAKDGVLQAFHLLNQFHVPRGAAAGIEHGKEVADYTLWASAADLKNLRYYFRTYENSRIRMDMKAMNLEAPDIRTISMQGSEQIEDASAKAK
jgi:Linear amide C-N hydrolases, choloylglycine hydrolase family